MRLSRRALLKASLGVSQLALLNHLARPAAAYARNTPFSGPTKLLTIYLPGGWQSPWAFPPFSDAQIALAIPPPLIQAGEPIYFSAAQTANLDGSTGSGAVPPLRMPVLWDAAALSAGQPDPRTGGATSPNGWAWKQFQLWNNACVVHGVDQTTVAHAGGTVSALSGLASSSFKSPSLQAWVADALFAAFPDRPLPSVWISGPSPESLSLRPQAAPSRITRLTDLKFLYSNQLGQPWTNLKASDLGSQIPPVEYDGGTAGGGFVLNPIEDRVSRRARSLRGVLNPSSEGVLQQIHDGLVGVSQVLAKDVTDTVAATQGIQYNPVPFWAPTGSDYFGVGVPSFDSDTGATWFADFDLALRLLKANVATSVAVQATAPSSQSWDNGHALGHRVQFVQVRAILEVVGRMLGEMKATPGSAAGRTLLDDTLVVVLSDFARTWPNAGPTSDHWQFNSVLFAGGGLQPNRMLGGYDVQASNAVGYDGVPLNVADSTGTNLRIPRSADVVTTALAVMGITGVRIPGGNGEILGVRVGT